MAIRRDSDDDAHNPFGQPEPTQPRTPGPKPGIFDPGYGDDDKEDPFLPGHEEKDGDWDDPNDVPGTRDA